MSSKISIWTSLRIIIVAPLVFLTLMPACSSKEPAPKPPAPVLAVKSVQKDVPYEIRAIGNIEASMNVIVKSQISGILSKVHFSKGQFVKKGALLFTIDPRPLQASLMQAKGALARDIAQLENARADERRYAELVKKGYISRQQYDQQKSAVLALEATVAADKAAVEYAKTQLSYCFIHAPISGHLGDIFVDEGNIVKANDDNKYLTTIRQTQPVTVSFSVPEKHLAEIKQYQAHKRLAIEVFTDNSNKNPEKGVLTFIDNTVDTSTGTIKLKGELKNENDRLWPGQFVNVSLYLYTQKNAVVVPSQAVQAGQMGNYVYVIRDDMTAELRQVTVARTYGDESVIEKGLKSDEIVVLDGHLRVTPDGKVQIRESAEKSLKSEPQNGKALTKQ